MMQSNTQSKWRPDFPLLAQKIRGRSLTYLDSAATALKPWAVIEKVGHFLTYQTANVHRGAHFLSDQATNEFEACRKSVCEFLNAASVEEIIFTTGTTGSINLVAHSLSQGLIKKNEQIIISEMEHHSNLVPWQMVAEKTGAVLKVIPIFDNGEINLEALKIALEKPTRLVALPHCSNVLGTISPLKEIARLAHAAGAWFLVDGAQGISLEKVDVTDLDVDFYVFSAHKLFGPYGLGILYGKKHLLEQLTPMQFGGNMIAEVSFEKTTLNSLPFRLEAGTPHIEGVIGLRAAIEYVNKQNWDDIKIHETNLRLELEAQLSEIKDLQILGQAKHKGPMTTFAWKGVHPSDLAQILDQENVAIRAGHLCAQPLLKRFNVPAFARASLSIYNQSTDVTAFITALRKAEKMLKE